MRYELLYIIAASHEPTEDTIKKEVHSAIEKEGGKFTQPQVTFKRKLAYPINHEAQGIYVAQRFDIDDPQKVAAITKALNLYGKVMRFIMVRADELPELKLRPTEQKIGERIKDPVRAKEIPAALSPSARPEKPVRQKEEKKEVSDEEIDKKLEEILNM